MNDSIFHDSRMWISYWEIFWQQLDSRAYCAHTCTKTLLLFSLGLYYWTSTSLEAACENLTWCVFRLRWDENEKVHFLFSAWKVTRIIIIIFRKICNSLGFFMPTLGGSYYCSTTTIQPCAVVVFFYSAV